MSYTQVSAGDLIKASIANANWRHMGRADFSSFYPMDVDGNYVAQALGETGKEFTDGFFTGDVKIDGNIPVLTSLETINTPISLSSNTTPATAVDISNGTNIYFTNSSNIEVRGFAGGVNGRIIRLFKMGAGTVTLLNENGSDTAANRITTLSGSNTAISSGNTLVWNSVTSRWKELV